MIEETYTIVSITSVKNKKTLNKVIQMTSDLIWSQLWLQGRKLVVDDSMNSTNRAGALSLQPVCNTLQKPNSITFPLNNNSIPFYGIHADTEDFALYSRHTPRSKYSIYFPCGRCAT